MKHFWSLFFKTDERTRSQRKKHGVFAKCGHFLKGVSVLQSNRPQYKGEIQEMA